MATPQTEYILTNRSTQQRAFEIEIKGKREVVTLGAREWSDSFETRLDAARYKALKALPVIKTLLARHDITFHTASVEAEA